MADNCRCLRIGRGSEDMSNLSRCTERKEMVNAGHKAGGHVDYRSGW